MNNFNIPAVIYCRVSSDKQVREGHGLESQEDRCTKYANSNGYFVERVFRDEGISGGGDFVKRKAMVSLLAYLDKSPHKNYVIIFDDLKRFARDTEFHIRLRQELTARKATPKCLNFTFDDSPEGQFVETIMAAQGELERKQNRRQVIEKQKARLERGYWTFCAPAGYKYINDPIHGKICAPDKNSAPIIKEALERFAKGVFATKEEFLKFLNSSKVQLHHSSKAGNYKRATQMLKNVFYAGYIHYPLWEVSLKKGHHKPIISLETYEKIQERLKSLAYKPQRKDIRQKFPLRGFVRCSCCGAILTASESTNGSGKKIPYYRCQKSPRECKYGGKSIPKDEVEDSFRKLLKSVKPMPDILKLFEAIITDVWEQKGEFLKLENQSLLKEINEATKMIESLVERITRSNNESVVASYEKQIENLYLKQEALKQKLEKKTSTKINLPKILEQATLFIENPYKIWENSDLETKLLVQKLVFPRHLIYIKNKGFGTPEIDLVYKVLEDFNSPDKGMVEVASIELASKEETNHHLRSVV